MIFEYLRNTTEILFSYMYTSISNDKILPLLECIKLNIYNDFFISIIKVHI